MGEDEAAGYIADVADAEPVLEVEESTSAMGHVMATKKPLVIEDAAWTLQTLKKWRQRAFRSQRHQDYSDFPFNCSAESRYYNQSRERG